jgi:DNA polymerase III sliding clamp (beta) subunit (PCNA family)
MKLQSKEFRDACRTILFAIDNKEASLFNETLELKSENSILSMNVTNREYYTTVKFNLEQPEEFHASVKASLFLKLIDKITTEYIDLSIDGNSVKVKGNGEYKLPIIYNNDVMLELPTIDITNVTNEMEISSDILQSIVNYNSKELLRGTPTRDVQKYYYIDNLGAITYTSGACVNSFTLPNEVKMLLSEKVVKLFKLFKDTDIVKFKMSQEAISEEMIQTRVEFLSGNVDIRAKLSDTGLITSVPVDSIRKMATKEYPYSVVMDKDQLLQILNRLMLFTEGKNYGSFDFTQDKLTISDFSGDNKEELLLTSECPTLQNYSTILNLNNLKLVLEGCPDQHITICFGDSRSVLIKKNNISDLVPELKVSK